MSEDKGYSGKVLVRTPLAGVFYRRPAPEDSPYVEVGSEVKKRQTLALIESMKVFNKLRAPSDGKVAEILVEDEQTVDTNQLIMVLAPL